MPLHLVGLGLADEHDITVKGLETVRKCARVYLEAYTSVLLVPKERLEAYYGRAVILADRELVETGTDEILKDADVEDVALLVVGDPFGATTHTDLLLRARERGIVVHTVHNASIMSAVGACGLQLYTFGQTVSIVFFTETWRPDSFYDKILANRRLGLHTLCLLDIKMKEQSTQNLMLGRKIYEPPRFMTVRQCIDQLLYIEERRGEQAYGEGTLCVGLARVGAADQKIAVGTMAELRQVDFGPPLHSFIIAGRMHFLERDLLRFYGVVDGSVDRHAEVV